MSARLKMGLEETALSQAMQGSALDSLRLLWRRKILIVAVVSFALILTSVALILYGPRYTGEATIQVTFDYGANAGKSSGQPIVPMDAIALVDSAAQVIRSRSTAGAVVDTLGLDRDPYFAGEPVGWRLLSRVRAALGLSMAAPSSRDLAVNALMQKTAVVTEPRSYVISIAITTSDPRQASTVVNAVALEYLKGQTVKRLADERAASERELADLSSIYGVHHPSYVLERAKLDRLQARLEAALPGRPFEDASELSIGEAFLPAEATLVPSGPNVPLILGLATCAALAAGVWLAIFLPSGGALRFRVRPARGERTLADATVAAFHEKSLRRATPRRIAIAFALIGWFLFLWSLVHASSQLAQERSLATMQQQAHQEVEVEAGRAR